MSNFTKRIVEEYKQTKKSSLLVYLVLRMLVILCMILQILRGDVVNALLCLLSLVLFTIPTIIQDKFKIKLPNLLECIIYLFIFSAEILGEIHNFYGNIPQWDTVLHTLNGFLAAGIGFSLVDLLNNNIKSINLSPIFVAIVAFCFSMTVGILWEFFEFGADRYLKLDMQKDQIVSRISSVELDPNHSNKAIVIENIKQTQIYTDDGVTIIDGGYLDIGLNDTIKDLFVNFIGAITFSVIGYIYIKNRDENSFASNFIPVRK